MTELRFDGQVALVTGGGAGLGRSHARDLARRGATVVINDVGRTEDGTSTADIAAEELRSQGFTATSIPGDVSVESDVVNLVEQTVAKYGRIDVVVNNAGGAGWGTTQETTTEQLSAALQVHLFGMFWTMREALGHMRKQDYGRVINTTSALGVFGSPGALPYVVAKAAICGLSRAASLDNLDRNIRINTLAPLAMTNQEIGDYLASRPDLFSDHLHIEFVTPAVIYLAHSSCELRGEILAAAGGRVARLFSAAVPGYASQTLDAEQVAANLDQVLDTDGFRILGSSMEQYDMLPRF